MRPLLDLLVPLFADRNRVLWDGYRDTDIRFPLKRIPAPAFSIRLDWSIDQLIEYVRTWSAYKHAAADECLRVQLETMEDRTRKRLTHRLLLELRLSVAAGRVL